MKKLALSKVYQLLEPGPVVLLTTLRRGRANVMTMTCHMMVEFEPPQIACVVSAQDFSFVALRETAECVIAIPPASLARTVVRIGNCSGRHVDKFQAFGLTTLGGKAVAAPLIADCIANLECRVIDTRLARRFNLFVLEVQAAWVDPARRDAKTLHHAGSGKFVIDGRIVRLASKMR